MLQPVTAIQKSVSTCLKIYRHCTSSLRTMPLHTRQLYPSRNWPSRIWCSWSSATQSRSCFYGPRHIFSYQITVKRVKFEDSDKLKYATCTIVSRIDSNWYSSVLNSWLMKCEEYKQWKWVKFKIAIHVLQKLQTVKCQTDSCELSVLCVYMHYNHKKLWFILVFIYLHHHCLF